MIEIVKTIQEFIQEITDEVLALGVFSSAIAFIYLNIPIPEFFAVILGMVAIHFFQKKQTK